MLLNAVKATNSRGAILNLPLEDYTGGIVVKEIQGLDPVKATLVSSSFANQDGEQYHSSRREPRDIKIVLGLDPDYGVLSVYDIRKQLYDFFMSKASVKLTFHMLDKFSQSVLTNTLDLDIDGKIESFDAPLFTEDPQADISVRCFNPDFYDPDLVTFAGATVADLTTATLEYDGTVETGVVFTLLVNRNVNDFTIYHTPPDGILRRVDFSYPLLTGDVLKISSVRGAKSVLLTRAGVETSILYAVTPQSSWLELQPGDNILRVYAVGAAIPFSIDYTNKYGGL